ncbi:FGGY carbohydrate kinase domain-containing protein-like [Saccoglossus kowalevskii]
MPGLPVGKGLSAQSASELGLILGTPVGAGLVDAYAGGLGVIACDVKGHNLACENQPITSRLPIICGTSTCHMAISDKPIFVDRVWGPFYSSMVPKFWVTEGGQSATGKLLDHIVQTHPAYNELKQKAQESNSNIYQVLNERVSSLGEKSHMKDQVGQLTTNLHIWPDFHGNRSPLADASLKGMICGLTLSTDIDNLAVLYLATIQAIAFGTRHILDALNGSGHDISTLIACGGLSKNSLFMQIHSDVTGLPVILPKEIESVLLGASMLGACASSDYSNIQEVMEKMSKVGHVLRPNCREREYYNKKYKVFLKMVEDQKVYQNMMK